MYQPDCSQFHRNPNINPDTGRTIKTTGDIYRRLVAYCGPPPTIQQYIARPNVTTHSIPLPGIALNVPRPNITTPRVPLPNIVLNIPGPNITTPKVPLPNVTTSSIPLYGGTLKIITPASASGIFNIPISKPNVTTPASGIPNIPISKPNVTTPASSIPNIPISKPNVTTIPISPIISPIDASIISKFEQSKGIIQNVGQAPRRYLQHFDENVDLNLIMNDIKSWIVNDITNVEINVRGGQNKRYDLMGYLMIRHNEAFIRNLVTALGFDHLDDTIDVFYNLLWHIHSRHLPFRTNLSDDEISYISRLPNDHLIRLFGNVTVFARDRASLLFSLISGAILPSPRFIQDKYDRIKNYPSDKIWRTAKILLNIPSNSIRTPYEVVAETEMNSILEIFLMTDEETVFELIITYQVVLPNDLDTSDNERILNAFLEQIKDYGDVFTRPANLPPPPPFSNDGTINGLQAHPQLRKYTTLELINAYEPQDGWNTRNSLINSIINESQRPPQWRWVHKHCKNDDTMNIDQFEPHGVVNKDDLANPTLSYGFQSNYRCYQVDELITMLREFPNEFRVPDYHRENMGIDPTTRLQYAEEFTLESARQLVQLLRNTPARYNTGNLGDLLNRYINAQTDGAQLRRLLAQYNQFTPEEQDQIKLFIAWLFFYGMWMRFWKGPNNDWPYEPASGAGEFVCHPPDRDEHIFIQNEVLKTISDSFVKNQRVNTWLASINTIKYNFQEGTYQTTVRKLIGELRKYAGGFGSNILRAVPEAEGFVCMGFGGDIFLQTAYTLMKELLGMSIDDVNVFIREKSPIILELERRVVNEQLAPGGEIFRYLQERQQRRIAEDFEIAEKARVLQERSNELALRVQGIYDFVPNQVRANRHEYRF
jgi:hypothetical protein